ncbi:site-specific integrase [Bacillus mesophilum]|uniref:Site-specific integrase n=1 Tax=Bacillus mesophilum TaxID=1071718 RepID=A0A7V7UWU1_9BACI|nr:site-specific integrase [Bacillus mesophilum]KAB2335110.1 site-specific integrase [Bacillus mesophilum]
MKGSIKKRGNTYTFITDGPRDSITGKRKQISRGGFKRKKDAEVALRKLLSELDENQYAEISNETLAYYLNFWFSTHYQKRVKETTVASRRYMMQKHLIDENPFSKKKLSVITTFDIDALYNQKIDEDYSTSYIRKIHQMLNQAFEQAKKWKKVLENPVSEASPPSLKKEEIKIWSFQEVHSFLANCQEEWHKIVFHLALYTGMRRGEILGLKWSDINFDKKIISVNHSLAFVPGQGYKLSSLKTKNAKRKIPVSTQLAEMLSLHKQKQEEHRTLMDGCYNEQELVICSHLGTTQDPQNVLRVMKRIIQTSGVPPIRFHDLRHTHASILISEGVDLVKVSKRLGHANAKITLEYYAHLMPNEDDQVADIFDQAMNRTKETL